MDRWFLSIVPPTPHQAAVTLLERVQGESPGVFFQVVCCDPTGITLMQISPSFSAWAILANAQ